MKGIIEYYNSIKIEQQVIFIDLIKDLIDGIQFIEDLKNEYNKIPREQKEIFGDIVEYFKEKGLEKVSGILMYKKIDYTKSKGIIEHYNINLPINISKLAVARKGYILKLKSFNIIQDLGIDIDVLYPAKEMQEEGLIKGEGKNKSFDLNYLEQERNNIYKKIDKNIKPTKQEIKTVVFHEFLQEFSKSYGEDQLNDDVNKDKSYSETLFYRGNKKDLKELLKSLTGEEQKEEKPIFNLDTGVLKYGDKSIEFELDKNPYLMLCKVFEDKTDYGIDIQVLYELLEVNYEEINSIKNGINRRFKNEFKTTKRLLVFRHKALHKDKWAI